MKPGDESESLRGSFSMPSEVGSIPSSVDKLVQLLKAAGCLEDKQTDIEMAAFEALANAVIHGNHEDASKRVHIRYYCRPGEDIAIVVKDEGAGFNPDKVPDPTAPENLEAEHGRGILMMRAFMDEVKYEAGGTELHLRKKLR
jgi:serine/threonine-protein kinase RsbW